MDTSRHNLSTLFSQLGLPSGASDIDAFLSSHGLDDQTLLSSAEFWTKAQAAFLEESIAEDSDWAEVVDELDARLRH